MLLRLIKEAKDLAKGQIDRNTALPIWHDVFALIYSRLESVIKTLDLPLPKEVAGYRPDGSPIFDNAASVVATMVFYDGYILLIRRATEPGKGKLALPGGFQMRGEKWQDAGAREVLEETGICLMTPSSILIHNVNTDEYDHNVIIGLNTGEVVRTAVVTDGEAEQVIWWDITKPINPEEWAFLLHYRAVRDQCGW
jgi:ADP-ribose pyrophosphatase YjhB (NUDIX family)